MKFLLRLRNSADALTGAAVSGALASIAQVQLTQVVFKGLTLFFLLCVFAQLIGKGDWFDPEG